MYIDYFANAVGQGQLSELKRAWNMGPGRVVEWGLGGWAGGVGGQCRWTVHRHSLGLIHAGLIKKFY